MTDEWWPGGYDNPAFRVKRVPYGAVEGGDYVRGSTDDLLPKTAVRMPRTNAVVTEGIGKGLLFARACGVDPAVLGVTNYRVVEVRWGWPTEIEFLWQEVALVRSAFGHPTVPEDGETIYRRTRAEAAIDRVSDDGTPYTVPAPFVYDYGWIGAGTPSMNSGYWYYYTLFFRINPVDWAAYMSDSVLLPTDYHHADHLWETVPPFYQWTDDNIAIGSGFLRRFLTIFGYELDHTREYVESVQKAQYADFSPISLLRHVGDNYGLAYEQGLGDIRFRALVANLARLHQIRGTRKGVEELIETGSKYMCDVTVGENAMMLPDDSDFFNGTGNWAPLHPSTPGFTTIAWGQVKYVSMTTVPTPPLAGGSRGVMRIDSPTTAMQSIMMTCGDGKMPTKDVVPLYSGIPTDVGMTIGFSAWIKAEKNAVVIPKLYLLWFNQSGQPSGILSSTAGGPSGATTAWQQYTMQAIAPANAVYVVPAIFFESRTGTGAASGRSPFYDVAAVTVYKPGEGGTPVAAVAPDRYLTMGDPAELLGPPKSGFPGYLIGTPGGQS